MEQLFWVLSDVVDAASLTFFCSFEVPTSRRFFFSLAGDSACNRTSKSACIPVGDPAGSACESAALELLEFEAPTATGTWDFLKKLSIFQYFAAGLSLEAISLAKFQSVWINSCGFSK